MTRQALDCCRLSVSYSPPVKTAGKSSYRSLCAICDGICGSLSAATGCGKMANGTLINAGVRHFANTTNHSR